MANPNPQFRVVEDEDQSPAQNAAAQTILLALTALSQRAIVSLASLYSVLLIGSVWYLFLVTLPNPNVLQLVGLAIYVGCVLAGHVIRRNK